jgi:hypothetical protein
VRAPGQSRKCGHVPGAGTRWVKGRADRGRR